MEPPADLTVDLVWLLVDDPPPNWLPLRPDLDPTLGPGPARLQLTGRIARSAPAADVADPVSDRAVTHAGRALARRHHLAYDAAERALLWAAHTLRAAAPSGAAGTAWDRADLPPRP